MIKALIAGGIMAGLMVTSSPAKADVSSNGDTLVVMQTGQRFLFDEDYNTFTSLNAQYKPTDLIHGYNLLNNRQVWYRKNAVEIIEALTIAQANKICGCY